ncbi:MAG: hypothetical protein O7B81_05970 [Gammaproteobacteria bacterium]|nr:hypothetical protein [Gammaproteobacteria bacterium]
MSDSGQWLTRLAPDVVTLAGDRAAHFGDVLGEAAIVGRQTTKTPLAECGVVAIEGPEAAEFLHAQLSAECLTLADGDTYLTAWCTPKGRVLYLLRLVRRGASYFALLPRDQAVDFADRLSKFVLRAKVEISDLSASQGVIVVNQNPDPTPIEVPTEAADAVCAASEDHRQCWIVGGFETLIEVWPGIAGTPVGENAAALADVRLGLPRLVRTLAETFLPQELNLDALGGVSFEKGCYPGQEIVARVKFRGAVKRRLSRLIGAGNAAPDPGARIASSPSGKSVGTVLVSAQSAANAFEVLGVLDLAAGAIALEGDTEAELDRETLPYSVAS